MFQRRIGVKVLSLLLLPLGLGGCPLDMAGRLTPGAGDALDAGTPPPPGRYWLEPTGTGWLAYALPERGGMIRTWNWPDTTPSAVGQQQASGPAAPEPEGWGALQVVYVGVGLYERSAAGLWRLYELVPGATFDDYLQIYDPRPAVPK